MGEIEDVFGMIENETGKLAGCISIYHNLVYTAPAEKVI